MRVQMPRSFFNVMAKEAHIADWREAFTYGQAKASGVQEILKLIVHVVEKQEERLRTRLARRGSWCRGRDAGLEDAMPGCRESGGRSHRRSTRRRSRCR